MLMIPLSILVLLLTHLPLDQSKYAADLGSVVDWVCKIKSTRALHQTNWPFHVRGMLIHMCVLIAILHQSACANLTYYIEENKSSGTFIGDIANDIDAKETTLLYNWSSLAFSQVKSWQTDSERLFRISKHEGKLYTAQILDAESLCSYNVECFQIVDVAIYQLTTLLGFLEIKVIIQDVNDHPPEFPVGQVSVEFSEGNRSGTRKAIPNAVDRDVGYFNSQVKYSLRKIHDEPFTLLVSNGFHGARLHVSLMLQGALDREIKDNYLLQVVAEDGGSPPLENVLDIQIFVSDVNDNSPVFTQKIYNVSAYNKPDSIIPVTVISANDSDLGQNGEIAYRLMSKTLVSAKSYFKLDPRSGKIFLKKKVSKKDAHVYKLYIEARDKGNPPLSAVTKVIVHLVSKKNNAPVIDIKFVFASIGNIVNISEDVKIGSFIAYITARDEDVGQNGEINCYLHHDLFRLENLGTKKFKVVLKSVLDRETLSNHNITVTCRDNGSPPLKSKRRFSVHVIDVNDVPPQFSQDRFGFWIHENQKPDFPVGFINATDPDSGRGCELTYSLLARNVQFLPFQISRKGFISTVSSLDRESKGIYKFRVLARDNGDPSLNSTVTVVVKVRDENDNAPYFTFPSVNPYNMDVTYYPHHTKNISQIKASDSDSQENAFLKYEIIRGNSKQIFSINQYTGLLCSTHILSQQDAGSYELEFLVKDSGSPVLSARTTVYLTLTVSNKTSEMLNAEERADEMELHIVISIGIVAVTISVILTVFFLACLIQHYENRHELSKKSRSYTKKFVDDRRQLNKSSYSACLQDTSSMTLATDFAAKDGAVSIESRERVKKAKAKVEQVSAKIVKHQKTLENFSEICVTAESNPTPVDELEEPDAISGPESLAWNTGNKSPAEHKRDWTKQNVSHDRMLKDLYLRSQRGIYSGEINWRTIKNPRLRNFVDEGTMIFSKSETTSSETLPEMRCLYSKPGCSRPISMASLYQLSRSIHDQTSCTTYQQRTLPITRL